MSQRKKIDLNSDVGESFGNYRLGLDEEVIPLITSANIACGFHAGDPCVMRRTIRLAKQNGVAVGAHPGLPDLMGFGRRYMDVSLEEIKAHIGDKVLLDGIPAVLFLPTYSREELMSAVERVVALFHPRLILGVSDEVPQGAEFEEAAKRVRMVSEWCREQNASADVAD